MSNPIVQVAQISCEVGEQGPKTIGQPVLRVLQPLRQSTPKLMDTDRCDYAVFTNQSPYLIRLCRPLCDQFFPDSVGGLGILLLNALDSNKPHSWTTHRLTDRLGID